MAWSPDGRLLAAAGRGDGPADAGFALVWDAATWRAAPRLDHPEPLDAVAFSPNGRMTATAAARGTIRLFDTGEGEQLHELKLDVGRPARIAFLTDDWLLVKQAANLVAYPVGHPAGVPVELGKSPAGADGPLFALSRDRGTVVVADGDRLRVLRPKVTADACVPVDVASIDARAQVVAASADGARVATFDGRGPHLRVWDAVGGRPPRRLPVPPPGAYPVRTLRLRAGRPLAGARRRQRHGEALRRRGGSRGVRVRRAGPGGEPTDVQPGREVAGRGAGPRPGGECRRVAGGGFGGSVRNLLSVSDASQKRS